MQKMKATVFHGPNNIRLEEVPRPKAGAGEALCVNLAIVIDLQRQLFGTLAHATDT